VRKLSFFESGAFTRDFFNYFDNISTDRRQSWSDDRSLPTQKAMESRGDFCL
jgi:hypothetical protein